MTKPQKSSIMSLACSEEELRQVGERWQRYDLPPGVSEALTQVRHTLLQGFFPVLDLTGEIAEGTAEVLGGHLAKLCMPCLELCYRIGYDLASGSLPREDGARYLLGAIRPIEQTFQGMLRELLEATLIDAEKSLELGSEMTALAIERANDVCTLGIENYQHRIFR